MFEHAGELFIVVVFIRLLMGRFRVGDDFGTVENAAAAFEFVHEAGGVAFEAGAGGVPLIARNILEGEEVLEVDVARLPGGFRRFGVGSFGVRNFGFRDWGARGFLFALFLQGEALFGDAVALFGGGDAAFLLFHFVFDELLLEGHGQDAAEGQKFGWFEVGVRWWRCDRRLFECGAGPGGYGAGVRRGEGRCIRQR